MSRVLVTGGSGFIGRHAVAKLHDAGCDVIAPASNDYDLTDPDQVRDLLRFTRPDILLHLAWYTEHGKFWAAPENKPWLDAGKVMLDQFLDQGGKRAVIAGSCAEYDWQNIHSPIRESFNLAPHTLYGQCKLDLWRHAEQKIKDGASILWGRLFLLYGPGEFDKRFVPDVTLSLLRGEKAKMSPGSQIRDFMHAKDAGEAFAAACLNDTVTGAVNIAQGEPVSLMGVAQKLHRLVGDGDLDPGAYPLRPDDPADLTPDITRLRDELGYTPCFTLDEGLADAVRYWREEGDW